jgi:dTDP-4-dehydrorhamnose reductase
MKKNVLIFGANGQLGQSLKSIVSDYTLPTFNFVFLSKDESNILNIETLEEVFIKYSPKYIINCAAYTQVDLAEDFKEEAYNINVTGTKNIAIFCNKYDSSLIHISTDFVFEGNKATLLKEDDICNPINYYGLSKLQGEKEIEKKIKEYFIIRTSWLYSEFGNNFVKTMLRLGNEKESLNVVNDQFGTPTYAVDLAEFLISIIDAESQKYGVYHYSNEGVSSWYDFSKAIFEYTNNSIKISPVASSEFKTKAVRPSFSVMDKTKVKTKLNIEVKHWRDSLKECLNKI